MKILSHKNKVQWFSIVAILFLLLPFFTFAESVYRDGGEVTITDEQTIEGNFYVFAPFGQAFMSGLVQGDMLSLASKININGEVEDDLLLAGTMVDVHGDVDGDVRMVANEAIVAGNITGDLLIFASKVNVLPTATISGDMFVFGGDVRYLGTTEGSFYGRVNKLSLNGEVGKSVEVEVATGFDLGADASIAEDVLYTSMFEVNRSPVAEITGQVVHNKITTEQSYKDLLREALTPYLIFLFTTLSLFLVFRRNIDTLVSDTVNKIWANFFIGGAVIILVPVLSVVLMLTLLGMFIGVVSLLVTIVLVIAGMALSSIVVGFLVSRYVFKQEKVTLPMIVTGSILIYVLALSSVLGGIAFIFILMLSVGGLSTALYRSVA